MADHAASPLGRCYLPQPSIPQACPKMTVFCDFDGPIVDVSDRYYQTYLLGLDAVQSVYQAKGVTLPIHPLHKQQFWQMKCDRIPDAEIAMHSGLQRKQIELFLERVTQIVNQPALQDQDRLQPGVQWALGLLRSQGMRLVLVTLRCQEQVIQTLEDYGLGHLFHEVWGSCDNEAAYYNHANHKTYLLEQAMQHAGGDAALYCSKEDQPSLWMVGDTEADILAGQSLGISTIALTCGIRSQAYLERFEPTYIYGDLLSAAHYLTSLSRQSALHCASL